MSSLSAPIDPSTPWSSYLPVSSVFSTKVDLQTAAMSLLRAHHASPKAYISTPLDMLMNHRMIWCGYYSPYRFTYRDIRHSTDIPDTSTDNDCVARFICCQYHKEKRFFQGSYKAYRGSAMEQEAFSRKGAQKSDIDTIGKLSSVSKVHYREALADCPGQTDADLASTLTRSMDQQTQGTRGRRGYSSQKR
ncbi:hypothetical protein B9479_002710 [Cryptococcus floricola]|uniref:Uncharacterized protein n=1 Tax=Cryptococcus floricola TaxID=2591691 RepID=A0A5D3B0K6_9TREE|nr:hypothetical protein B9479_002710 [Cryptococcus floricola]